MSIQSVNQLFVHHPITSSDEEDYNLKDFQEILMHSLQIF